MNDSIELLISLGYEINLAAEDHALICRISNDTTGHVYTVVSSTPAGAITSAAQEAATRQAPALSRPVRDALIRAIHSGQMTTKGLINLAAFSSPDVAAAAAARIEALCDRTALGCSSIPALWGETFCTVHGGTHLVESDSTTL